MRRAALWGLSAVVVSIGAGSGGPLPDRMPHVDPARFGQAAVVVRAELVGHLGGDQPWWFHVRVLAVLKNEPARRFGPTLDVAVPTFAPQEPGSGIPPGSSTLYLVPYNGTEDHPWKLLGGSTLRGVSHVAPPPR